MPVRRRRRPGSDRLYVTSDRDLPLGHFDLVTRTQHDVPATWRETFLQEVNGWLWDNGLPPIGAHDHVVPAIGSGGPVPEGGWEPGEEDLARHLPGHGLAAAATRARSSAGEGADRPARLRADGQQAVADALAKLSRRRIGRGGRWRMLHAVPMDFEGGQAYLDHVVVGPPGIFAIEVAHHPGGRAVLEPTSLEIDDQPVDLGRRRRIGVDVEQRISEGLARAVGAESTDNPPPVIPVMAIVGAVLIGSARPAGVLVSRLGPLPRLLQAFGSRLPDAGVEQVFAVARRSVTWTG